MYHNELLGAQLLEKELISDEQLQLALERQRVFGGRLGYNLMALGFVNEKDLADIFKRVPPVPNSIKDTGLELSFLVDLINKHVLFTGEFTMPMLVDKIKLPLPVVHEAVEVLRRERLVEVKGAKQMQKTSYRFALTDTGRNRAGELLNICKYTGPAPVTLDDYRRQVETQSVMHISLTPEELKQAFSHLVVSESLLKKLGRAVSSGRPIFLYGPPGNGKSSLAEALGRALPGEVYVPHALIVGGEIIILGNSMQQSLTPGGTASNHDKRWIRVKRPTLVAGSELTMRTLDLDFNPVSKFYEAPQQLKANNGLFIIDDLGRQQMDIDTLLNRWITPMESRTDLLTLHTGRKFEIPFDQLMIFCTNIDPKKLLDAAFLRRLRHKINIDKPSQEEYFEIFLKICRFNNMEFNNKAFSYLMDTYKRLDMSLSCCHPRDIIEHIVDDALCNGHHPVLTEEKIDMACNSLFIM